MKLKGTFKKVKCMIMVLILCMTMLAPANLVSVKAEETEENSYIVYVHENYGDMHIQEFDITDKISNMSTNCRIDPSFYRTGYRVIGYSYDEWGFEEIPEGMSAKDVYFLYDDKSGYFGFEAGFSNVLTSEFHMYAMWAPILYYITYDLDGGINHSDNPSTYIVDSQTITLQEPTKEGYKFLGWYKDEIGKNGPIPVQVTTIEKGSTGDIEIYAKWECLHIDTTMQNYVEATCCEGGYTGDVYCNTCENMVGFGEHISPTGEHAITITGKVEPTCVSAGNTGDKYCTASGALIQQGEEIAATGIHTGVVKDAVAPTCSEKGYSGDTICSVCGATLEVGTELPKTGHVWDNGVVTKEATYATTGIRTFTCQICNTQKQETIPMLVKECEHSNTETRYRHDATCTLTGYTGDVYCTDCEQLLEYGEEIEKTEHVYDDGVVTVEPTTETTGVMTYTCTGCGVTKEEEIPVVENTCVHINKEIRNKVDATCRARGYSGDTYCTDCNTLLVQGKAIEKAEHSYDAGFVTLEPTIDAPGSCIYTCTVCGETKTEEIPAIAVCEHPNSVVINTKAASCDEAGYTGDTYCPDCDKKLTAGTVVDKLNHNWVATSTGTYKCSLCGNYKTEENPGNSNSTDTGNTGTVNNGNNTSVDSSNSVSTPDGTTVTPDTNAEEVAKQKAAVKKIKVKISSAKNVKGRKIQIKLKKQKGYKYQIKVSTSKKFKKGVKTYTTSKVKYKTKKLSKGKTYYVKARVYKVINGETVYGKWSAIKKVKIKK